MYEFYGPISPIFLLNSSDICQIKDISSEEYNILLNLRHKFKMELRNILQSKSFDINSIAFQNYCLLSLQKLEREVIIVFFISDKKRLIVDEIMSVGGSQKVLLDYSDIVKRCFMHNATSIIVAHNHPSGSPTPSQGDIKFSHSLQKACALLDFKLLASLVVGDNDIVKICLK